MKKGKSKPIPYRKWMPIWPPRRLALVLLVAGIGFVRLAATDTLPLPERFQNELAALHTQYGFPGATAAYRLPDGTTGTAAIGLADREREIPMAITARMPAASIGKTFVGATVLALVQEGRLALDEPIATWLGDRAWFVRLPNHDRITLRQLLNHTAGIANHVVAAAFARDLRQGRWPPDRPPAATELIGYILDQPPLFPPGAGWHYSDTGYLLVGLIIEQVTGRSFYAEITERFLIPHHLDLTTPANRRRIFGLAAGYLSADNAFGLPPKTTIRPGLLAWHPGIEGAGGGFVSNSQDLVVWAGRLFTGKALAGNYRRELLRAVPVDPAAPGVSYGIGVGIYADGPLGPTYGHGGWIPGYSSSLRYYPEYGIAIALQLNTDIGIVDDTSPVVQDAEVRLARIVAAAVRQ